MTRLILIALILISSCREKGRPSEKAGTAHSETKVIVRWDTLDYVLQSCSATLDNENLRLYIERDRDSYSNYAIEIIQKGKEFDVALSQPWSVTDSLYVAPRFRILDQNVRLDKLNYKKGENVQGELNFLALGRRAYVRESGEMKLRENWDTVYLYGVFSSIVK